MTDETDNDDRVVNLFNRNKTPKKEQDKIVNLTINYTNGTVELEECHWFGESVEIPGLFIFGKNDAELPDALINLEHVRRINVKKEV